MKIIIVASSPKKSFYKLYHHNPSDYLIGVDGGTNEIINKGLKPDLAIGDFDSTQDKDRIKEKSFDVLTYPTRKDDTDLELALKYLENLKGAKNLKIDIYDALGGRLDHEYMVYRLLEKYNMYDLKVIDENHVIKYISSTYIIDDMNISYFSIFPLCKSNITITSAAYNINSVDVDVDSTYLISNEIVDKTSPTIIVNKGAALLFMYKE